MTGRIVIREIGADEFGRAWPIMAAVIAGGDAFTYPADLTVEQARDLWATAPARCFFAELGDDVLGAYSIKPNQIGRGDHVANGSYMVSPQARGMGVASAMCLHSLEQARRAGFTAMQFNIVVSSNRGAVRLWQKHGFTIVGTVPGAFRHATLGPTDIYVMHREL